MKPIPTYVCPQRGVELPDRRQFVRPNPPNPEVEQLFNGFHNLMGNVNDNYLCGYVLGMMEHFAKMVRSKDV
jgi:hypothetical protein